MSDLNPDPAGPADPAPAPPSEPTDINPPEGSVPPRSGFWRWMPGTGWVDVSPQPTTAPVDPAGGA